jgi:hypothetical protein
MLQAAVVALMCHLVPVADGKTVEACHEEIVWQGDDSPGVCNFAQAIIAQWKGAGRFAGDEWLVKRFQCLPGHAMSPTKDHI